MHHSNQVELCCTGWLQVEDILDDINEQASCGQAGRLGGRGQPDKLWAGWQAGRPAGRQAGASPTGSEMVGCVTD